MVPKCPSEALTRFHIKASSSAKADDPVLRGPSIERWPGRLLDTPLELVIGLAKRRDPLAWHESRFPRVPPLAFLPFWPKIGTGRLAVDEPLANRVRSGRKQP